MLAILGMTIKAVEQEINSITEKEKCEIANDNCNGQIVVSGKKAAIENLKENLKKKICQFLSSTLISKNRL